MCYFCAWHCELVSCKSTSLLLQLQDVNSNVIGSRLLLEGSEDTTLTVYGHLTQLIQQRDEYIQVQSLDTTGTLTGTRILFITPSMNILAAKISQDSFLMMLFLLSSCKSCFEFQLWMDIFLKFPVNCIISNST